MNEEEQTTGGPVVESIENGKSVDGTPKLEDNGIVETTLSVEQPSVINSINGQHENSAPDGQQVGQDQPNPSTGDSANAFEFKYTDNGYHYYNDPDGKWYAQDEAGYWYYQDADGSFKPWDHQPTSNQQSSDSDKGDVGKVVSNEKVEALGDGETSKEQNQDDAMVITDENDDYKSIVEIGPDGRPQYPRRSDGKPILPIGPDGRKVFPLGRDGKPMFPADDNGRPTFPVGDDGQPVFPIGPHGKPIVPLDENDLPIFPLGADGVPIFPVGQDGKPCAPVAMDGRIVLPRGADGKAIVPYDRDGQPLIIIGLDGTPVERNNTSKAPPTAPSQQNSDWDAYYQQYYQYYNYQYPYYQYPYGTGAYDPGNSYGGHTYASVSSLVNPTPPQPPAPKRRVRPEDIDLPPGPPPKEPGLASGLTRFGHSDQNQSGSMDEKQSATKQLVARQMRALSLMNQFKRDAEKAAENAKKPAAPQPVAAPRAHRSRFDITDKMKAEQVAATSQKPVAAFDTKFQRQEPAPPAVDTKQNKTRSRSPSTRRSPNGRNQSPVSKKRNHSRSPHRRDRSISPDQSRGRRKDDRARHPKGGRSPREALQGRRGRSKSSSRSSTERTSKSKAEEQKKEMGKEKIWAPESAVRSNKDESIEIRWAKDMLAKTRTSPALWYSCRPDQWTSFEKLIIDKEHGADKEQDKGEQAVPGADIDSQMYGPRIAPPVPTTNKWKPFVAEDAKEQEAASESKMSISSSDEESPVEEKPREPTPKKDKKRNMDPELERLRHEALATMEQARKDYEYYENLAKQRTSSSEADDSEASKSRRKGKEKAKETEDDSSTESSEDKKKKRKREKRKKRKRKHRRRVSTDEDAKEESDEESDGLEQDEEEPKRKGRRRTSMSSDSEQDESDDGHRKRHAKKKKRKEKRHAKKEKRNRRHKRKRSTEDEDESDSEVEMSEEDSDESHRKKRGTSESSKEENFKKRQVKGKHGKKRRHASPDSEKSEDENEEESPRKRVKRASGRRSSEERKTQPSNAEEGHRSGDVQQVKRGFFIGDIDAATGPSTLPDIPLPRECYSTSGKSGNRKHSPPPPPPKEKKKSRRDQSPPPPPPPKKPGDFMKQQFGSPTAKVGQLSGSGQPIFVPVATYRAFAPQLTPTMTSTKNYPYGGSSR